MSRDAEDFDLNLTQRPGNPVRGGFQDKDGVYPKRDYDKTSDVNNRGTFQTDVKKTTLGTRTARKASKDSQTSAKLVSEPQQSARSTYPKNQTIETRSGHLIEYDDTPGNERLNFQHRTGSRIEMLPDGSVFLKSQNRSYQVVASDSELVVRGQCLVVIESNADIRVQGDATMQVDGDLNQLVQGDYNLEVQGDKKERVHGNSEDSVTGGRLTETRGNTIRRNLSNVIERTLGDHTQEFGGNWRLTTEGSIAQRSYGEFNGSYFGGTVTWNGFDKEGTEGEGNLVVKTVYGTDLHFDNIKLEGTADIKGVVRTASGVDIGGAVKINSTLDVDGTIKAGGDIHTSKLQGTAVKAEFADTAAKASLGTPIPKIPNPSSPSSGDDPEDREENPTSSEGVTDVIETSDAFILNLDRKPESKFNSRILNTGEVIARARNDWLRNDQDWVSDQVNQGSVNSSITGGSPPRTIREGSETDVSYGDTSISQTGLSSYKIAQSNRLRIESIPKHMKPKRIARSTMLSPNFRVSHMLAGDGLSVNLCEQGGLSRSQLFDNMQYLAYNILEPLREKFKDTWTISEGLYCPFEEEKIGSGTVTAKAVQGLAVGIQFPSLPNSNYFEAAQWMRNHLTYDELTLSYLDYDPSGINEPTILISIDLKNNERKVKTEFNHRSLGDNILDLSDD